ncbi:MAG: glycine zipper domain-containing protein [Bacillota bacterium]
METTNLSTGNGSDKMSSAGSAAKTMYSDAKGSAQRVGATLRSELSSLKNDLDALMSRAPSLSDDELSQAHTQLMAKFSSMRYAAKGLANEASRQFNRGMESTTEYVKDKPMQSLAVAAGAGLLLGLLFKRR